MFDLRLKIPPPFYFAVFAAIMWWLNQQLPLSVWLSEPWNLIGWWIIALSFIPVVGAFIMFFRHKTTVNPHKPEKASSLVTGGIYNCTRNPMYLSLTLLLTGLALYHGSLSSLLFPPLFVWVITQMQIKPEERVLEKLFGERYLEYKLRVRRWL